MAKAQTKRRTPKKAATPAANAVKKLKGIPSGYVTDALARLGLSGWMGWSRSSRTIISSDRP